jgi:hypothetical protein
MTQQELFTQWQSAPNNVPQPICGKLLGQFPQLLDVPVIWSQIGANFKAQFQNLNDTTVVLLGASPTNGVFCILELTNNIAQQYLPERLKNSIKELAPGWTGTGLYTSPVVRVRETIITNGNPLPLPQNVYSVTGVEASFVIDFDTENITNAKLKETTAYRVKSTVTVTNKSGDIA